MRRTVIIASAAIAALSCAVVSASPDRRDYIVVEVSKARGTVGKVADVDRLHLRDLGRGQ